MSSLKKCAEVYNKYVGNDYTFITDCDFSIKVRFPMQSFYHLVGLHYLKDVTQISNLRVNNSTGRIYKQILKGSIKQKLIENSCFYDKIKERLTRFPDFDKVVSSKIIVDFDYTKVNTKLKSKYLLYNEYDSGYEILGLKYDSKYDVFVPETFIVEKTDYYIKNQITYDIVNVEITPYM